MAKPSSTTIIRNSNNNNKNQQSNVTTNTISSRNTKNRNIRNKDTTTPSQKQQQQQVEPQRLVEPDEEEDTELTLWQSLVGVGVGRTIHNNTNNNTNNDHYSPNDEQTENQDAIESNRAKDDRKKNKKSKMTRSKRASSSNNHDSDTMTTYKTFDPIESHRQKKESLFAHSPVVVGAPVVAANAAATVGENDETRDQQQQQQRRKSKDKGNNKNRWSRWRRGNKQPETTASDKETRDGPAGAGAGGGIISQLSDPWSGTDGDSLTNHRAKDLDTCQRSAVYRQFCNGHYKNSGANTQKNKDAATTATTATPTATNTTNNFDPVQAIQVEETASLPTPTKPHHVVVKITASTVTVQDCIMRHGLDFNLTEPVGLPATSGRDFVGFVLQCGTKVDHFKPGDRVAGLLRSGGNARYAVVPQDSLVLVPKYVDGAEAACMVSVYTSAYQAINMATKDSSVYDLEGKRVLVVGGMDGTGQAIIQMCRKAKATVFATAPDRRHAYVRSILNATPLPENPIDWSNEAKGSMDVVFDGNCEGDMKHSYRALSEKGRLVCFGHSSLLCEDMGWFGVPMERRLQRMKLEAKSNTSFHDIWDSFRKDPDTYKKNLQALFQLLLMKKVKPQIAKRVALDEVGLSHRKLEQGQVRGTVVCLPWKRVSRRKIRNLDKEEEEAAQAAGKEDEEKSNKE